MPVWKANLILIEHDAPDTPSFNRELKKKYIAELV